MLDSQLGNSTLEADMDPTQRRTDQTDDPTTDVGGRPGMREPGTPHDPDPEIQRPGDDIRTDVPRRDWDPDRDRPAQHEQGTEAAGAGGGALGGAAVGGLVGGPVGAVVGGAVGAATGAAVGEAVEGHDKAGAGAGGAGGALAGAAVGGAIAGPPGAVVGGAVGAGAGAGVGDKAEEKAKGEDDR
jgi:hypothetical protein